MQRVTLSEAKRHLLELVNAAINGEEVLIVKDDQQAVKLVPIVKSKRHREFGSAKGLIHMADDFDAPLEDFKEYME